MPPLLELQRAIADGLRSGDFACAACAVVDDAPGPEARLRIYRHHLVISLSEALARTYPALRRRVGPALFDAAAREFAKAQPPSRPALFEYGEAFPRFLAALPASEGGAVARDLGRLEWAIHAVRHASDQPAVDGGALAAIPPSMWAGARFAPHPACRLLASPHPVDALWRALTAECAGSPPPLDPAVVETGGVRLLVGRDGEEVGWLRLSRAEFAFLGALARGRALGAAFDAAARGFDAAATLGLALARGVFASIRVHDEEKSP